MAELQRRSAAGKRGRYNKTRLDCHLQMKRDRPTFLSHRQFNNELISN